MITAFLYDELYIFGVLQFFGVKISIILPLIFIALYFYVLPHRFLSFFYLFKRLLSAPVQCISLICVGISGVFVVVYLLRSGHYISFQLPFIEVWLREGLEKVLLIRPRTKEFLIGYPFIFMGCVFVGTYFSRKWLWFFMMLGSVAMVSVVNSFCHLHTPILVSFFRSLLGLLLGGVISGGMIGCFVLSRWFLRKLLCMTLKKN